MADDKKRLNIAVDSELHRQLKIAVAESGKTIVQYVNEAIQEKIERERKDK